MLYAIKENKTYEVTDKAQREDFLKRGYDIADETGKIVEHSPGKTVPYAQYAALLGENAKLREQLATAPAPEEEPEKSGKRK